MEELRHSMPMAAERLDRAAVQMPKPGQRVFGFELTKELGEGAFAKVFLALQSELADRQVVLKVAPNLRDEPRKLARLQHTNIVPIYSVHQSGALHAVCMPYLGSITLADVLQRISGTPGTYPDSGRALLNTLFDRRSTETGSQQPSVTADRQPKREAAAEAKTAPPAEGVATPILDMMERLSHVEAVLWIGARLTDALAHAHARGILHLDIKPANILLADDGQPMLLDFNLSIDLSDPISKQLARIGGTLPYMSPEQLAAFRRVKRDIDARSDLYSLGVILFELLTKNSPYPRRLGKLEDVVAAMAADRRVNPPSVCKYNKAISPAVASIIRKLLDIDPARRYQNAAQLREDIERQLRASAIEVCFGPLDFGTVPQMAAAASTFSSSELGCFLRGRFGNRAHDNYCSSHVASGNRGGQTTVARFRQESADCSGVTGYPSGGSR